ncbi:MAG: hypothetical protein IPJ89_02345 [Candidatus Iainarchaeum archaeon]|uniref:Transcription regulator TrmB N-terminal domain-containing protein n=1 Tax=Candidatus Iainarchaeum sp. TaxID=3101447 RepID=A0A7T9DKM6_9ARCH|nr:MAG: hypothetical protein IPJ89_02345 [Candidatus Diapherotrites archaeon]
MDMGILGDIGLSKAEINVYVSLLELGASTSGPIIARTGMQNSVVHRALKRLIDRGLVAYVKRGKDRHYQAGDPANLVNYLEGKKKRLEDILPELKQKQSHAKEKNETEMFLGKRAIFSLLNNLIKDARTGEDYLSFSLIEPHNDEEVIRFYNQHNLRRRERKLAVKVLVNEKVRSIFESHYSRDLLKRANVRYTSFSFPQGIVMFRDNVIFLNWQDDPFAVKITNALMAKQFKHFFLDFYANEKDAY